MSKRIFNIVRPREYNANGGEVKTAWDRHGVLVVDGKKLSIHLDSIPTGEWNGWFNVFEREDDQQGQANNGQGHQQNNGYQQQAANPQHQPPPQSGGFDDDIPF
jgi:hypothetical protein